MVGQGRTKRAFNTQLSFLRWCLNLYIVLFVKVFEFYQAKELTHFNLGAKMLSRSRRYIGESSVGEIEDQFLFLSRFLCCGWSTKLPFGSHPHVVSVWTAWFVPPPHSMRSWAEPVMYSDVLEPEVWEGDLHKGSHMFSDPGNRRIPSSPQINFVVFVDLSIRLPLVMMVGCPKRPLFFFCVFHFFVCALCTM